MLVSETNSYFCIEGKNYHLYIMKTLTNRNRSHEIVLRVAYLFLAAFLQLNFSNEQMKPKYESQ